MEVALEGSGNSGLESEGLAEEVMEQPVYKIKVLELPAGVQAIFKITKENNNE